MFTTGQQPGGGAGAFLNGYVAGVDLVRMEAKVRGEAGQTLPGVRWLQEYQPNEGDRVLMVRLQNNEYVIMGSLAQPQNSDQAAARPALGQQGVVPADLADYSKAQSPDVINTAGPADQRPGDWVKASKGGGVIALLRGGTVMMKSSPTSMVMTSKYDDLVRIVSRNFEHFTDMDSTYKVSTGGGCYSKHEFFRSTSDARSDRPAFREVRGNVASGAGGADGGELSKRSFFNADGVETSTQTDYISGRRHQLIQTGASIVEKDDTITGSFVKVHGGDTTFFNMNETSVHLDVSSDITVDANKDGIILSAAGQATIKIPRSGKIEMTCSADMEVSPGGNLEFNVGGNTTFTTGDFTVIPRGTINLG